MIQDQDATSEGELDEFEPEVVMGRAIREWLEDEDEPEWQLLDWLRGYDLPSASGGEEPYLWLMRGLENIGQAKEPGGRFCERVAAVLERSPEITDDGDRPEQVLFNLFMLSACLHCPVCLANSLYKIHDEGRIGGKWRGIDLKVALRMALVQNQADQHLRPLWEDLVDRRSTQLPGDEIDGFAGLVKMPAPDEEVILAALSRMVEHLETAKGRVRKLLGLFDGLSRARTRIDWPMAASRWARKYEWEKRWAIAVVGHLLSIEPARSCERPATKAERDFERSQLLENKILVHSCSI